MQIEGTQNRINTLERTIKNLHSQIEKLKYQNSQLRNLHNASVNQMQKYKMLLNKDPLYMIMNQIEIEENLSMNVQGQQNQRRNRMLQNKKCEELEGQLITYRAKIKQQQKDIAILKNEINRKNTIQKNSEIIIDNLQKKIKQQITQQRILIQQEASTRNLNTHLIGENTQLREQLEKFQNQLLQYKRRTITNSNQSAAISTIKQTVTQLNNMYTQSFALTQSKYFSNLSNPHIMNFQNIQFNQHNISQLKQINKKLLYSNKQLNEINIKLNGNNQILNQKIKTQSTIMEELGKQLQQRKQQLFQYRLQHIHHQDQNKKSPQDINDKHNLKSMYQNYQQLSKQYQQLLQNYHKTLSQLDQSVTQKKLLQKQYHSIKNAFQASSNLIKVNQSLIQQLQSMKRQSQNNKAQFNNLVAALEQTAIQNSCLHQFMKDIYSKEYVLAIQQQKNKYQQRLKIRESKQAWATVQELIQMNRKLRQRLSRRH